MTTKTTPTPETWAAARRDFHRDPDTRPRALGKLARAHGLRLAELRERIERDRWDLEVRQAAAARRASDNARRLARGRRHALREIEKLTPLLRKDPTDPRTLRAVALAAFQAGRILTALYGVGANLAEDRRDQVLAQRGAPVSYQHPWGGLPARRRASWAS
ncbi:hypothetical protein [Anaeromyxobacter soli]|uniref:hypothetical protein n=1 Tax=Anaeromyxobacter soli TaxID=2922725 RepID=UPI001FAE7E2E|nr:hypothetical protein [Anaeromyxobacter sp. SG29]